MSRPVLFICFTIFSPLPKFSQAGIPFKDLTQGNVEATLWQHWVWQGQTQCYYNVATTLKMKVISQRSGNIGIVRKLRNCMTLPQRRYNVENDVISQCSQSIQAMMCERCINAGTQHWNLTKVQLSGNAVTMSWHCWKLCYFRCCHNYVTMLPLHCVNVVGWPKYQRSHNIVSIFRNKVIFNVVTTLLQHWRKKTRIRNPILR